MAFPRHNIEKRRLIEMVRLNPILWDCRLPHYKRSDKLKAIKWHELGITFGETGERVQRTFTSLREIFRRELNHEKLVGRQYESKWEYYDAMAFLREVIRERKPRDRATKGSEQQPSQQRQQAAPLNPNSGPIDEYSYFAPNDPNNPNVIQRMLQQQQQHEPATQPLRPDLLMNLNTNILSDFLAKYNTSVASSAVAENSPPPQQQQQEAGNHNATESPNFPTTAGNPVYRNVKQQQQLTHTASPQRADTVLALSSTLSGTNSPLTYIKEEPLDESTHDECDSLATSEPLPPQPPPKRIRRALSASVEHCSPPPTVAVARCLSAGHRPKGADGDTANPLEPSSASVEEYADDDDDVEDDDEDLLEDPVLGDIEDVDVDLELGCLGAEIDLTTAQNSPLSCGPPPSEAAVPPQRVATNRGNCLADGSGAKETLYSKFGEFLAARLNSLAEPAANELMNKMLMLIAEK